MTVVVLVLGAIVTGSISLVLEDLLPKLNAEDTIVYPRWLLLASSVLLVAFAVWLRYEVRSYSGTLFSVQVLDEGVADRAGEGTDPKLTMSAGWHLTQYPCRFYQHAPAACRRR